MIDAAIESLSQPCLDLSQRSGPHLRVRIVERPGVWMEQAALLALTADLRRIGSKTLAAGSLTYGVFSGDVDRLRDTPGMHRAGATAMFIHRINSELQVAVYKSD